MTLAHERNITTKLLIDDLDMWDEFDIRKNQDPQVDEYYKTLLELINQQIQNGIKWLDSDDARDYFFGEAEYQQEVFRSLEEEWDNILNDSYDNVEELLEEVYHRGKQKGYSDIKERIRYTETDKLALTFARYYNFGLITKLDNDVRNQIKNVITEGVIAGEHPSTIAPKILNVAEKQLRDSIFTPKHRATMIARTEVSRIQNTGILQSYINESFTAVKILTAEDNNVCYTCLRYAFEFNEDAEVTFATRGEERVHNIFELLKGGSYPPFHPLCRCTYLCVWGAKGGIPDDFAFVNITPNDSSFFNRYKAPENAKPIVFTEEILRTELKGIVDSGDIDSVLKVFEKFNGTVSTCDCEWILGATNKGYIPEKAHPNWDKRFVNLHSTLNNLESSEKLLTVVHNHIWGLNLLPSDKDLKLYVNNKVKYGVITNERGMFIIRNNNKTKFSEDEMDRFIGDLANVEDMLVGKWEEKEGMVYDKKDDDHKFMLNEYVNDNFETWFNEYNNYLSKYNIEVKFINAKKYNK